MDKELMDITTEENIEVSNIEITETEVTIEYAKYDVPVEETEVTIEVEDTEEMVIQVDETIGWVGGDSTKHYSLLGRDEPNQHTIKAITGLRAELDEIERLKTVCSDKFNIANYYEWSNGAYDIDGYFVSVVDGDKIQICNGADIFGVVVEDAGFVGNQLFAKRDESYGLVVTSGIVDVRCELDVKVGDHVVSNSSGYAKKSTSNYGYRVFGTETKDGVPYAVIALGIQSDVVDALGADLNVTKDRVDANYKKISSAINVANQAYNKALEIETSNQIMSGKVNGALGVVDRLEGEVSDLATQTSNAVLAATQAQAIAQSAATSAESMKNEAVASLNATAAQVGELTKTLEPLTTWTDPYTSNIGTSYLIDYINNGLATKAEIQKTETDLEHATSAVQQNAMSIQSIVVSIDKYSVGPYSQAYGLTLEQAISVLEEGIIYVPTENKTDDDAEVYSYTDENGDIQTYTRTFLKGYLYQWGKRPNGLYGWITVDKDYNAHITEEDANPESEINTSEMAVYFSTTEIAASSSNNYGYWYTNGKTITNLPNSTVTYEPYTLYKWDLAYKYNNGVSDIEEYRWNAVATLAGNSKNRAVSQIRQTVNGVSMEVTDVKEDVAKVEANVDEAKAEVALLTAWRCGDTPKEYSESIIKQTSDDDGASITISAYQRNEEGVVEKEAKLVLHTNGDGSALLIDANSVKFGAQSFQVDADCVNFDTSKFVIKNEDDYTLFEAGDETVAIGEFNVERDNSRSYFYSGKDSYTNDSEGVYIGTDGIGLGANKFHVRKDGYLFTKSGEIAGWQINETNIAQTLTVNDTDYTVGISSNFNSDEYNVSGETPYSPVFYVKTDHNGQTEWPFLVSSRGALVATKAHITGTIAAKDGTIGSWKIKDDATSGTSYDRSISSEWYDSSNQKYYTVGLKSGTDGAHYAFFVNQHDVTGKPGGEGKINLFAVTYDGSVIATKGQIGGWDLTKTALTNYKGETTSDGYYPNSFCMQVNTTGNLLAIGKCKSGDWSKANFRVQADGSLYAKSGNIAGWKIGSDGFTKSFTSGSDTYSVGLYAALYNNSVADSTTLYVAKNDVAQFYIRPTGEMYAKNATIDGGQIILQDDSDKWVELGVGGGLRVLDLSNLNGYYACAQYSANILRYGRSTSFGGQITNTNEIIYQAYGTSGYIQLAGTWSGTSSGSIVSDRRLKNNIECLDERYGVLFDNLIARRFHYNDGTSQRYHTGYIAQEVQSAISVSGVSEKEFAALCTFSEGQDDEFMGLRYEEFVSLNTWQIQKLKPRVLTLEEKVQKLEAENATLKEQVEQLLNND